MAALDTLENKEGEGESNDNNVNQLYQNFPNTQANLFKQGNRKVPPPPPPRQNSHMTKLNPHINTQHENKLIELLIDYAMHFQSKIRKNDKSWTLGDFDPAKTIQSWYKIDNYGYCHLRSVMHFDEIIKYHSVQDYFDYLECGTNNNEKYMWDDKTETKVIETFDTSHQFMCSKAQPGILKLLGFSPRDMYYMATRFQRQINYANVNLTVVGSLNYSDNKMEPKHNNICATIKYRGILLIHNDEFVNNNLFKWVTKAVYVSCFDPNISLIDYVKKQYLKSKGLDVMTQFKDSWINKMEFLEKRRMHIIVKKLSMDINICDDEKKVFGDALEVTDDGMGNGSLKDWLDNINLGEYYNVFVKNGFESVVDLTKNVQKEDLIAMGIEKVGDRLKLLHAIQKL